jgi:hypothetical protein
VTISAIFKMMHFIWLQLACANSSTNNLFTISSEGKGYSNDMTHIENKSEWIFKDLMKKNKDRIKIYSLLYLLQDTCKHF